jgi:hypothetical protein
MLLSSSSTRKLLHTHTLYIFCSLCFTTLYYFLGHYAEYSGYWETTSFLSEIDTKATPTKPISFYDSNTGKLLFTAPSKNRSWQDFLDESRRHGWPSFRDDEVRWRIVTRSYASDSFVFISSRFFRCRFIVPDYHYLYLILILFLAYYAMGTVRTGELGYGARFEKWWNRLHWRHTLGP